MNRLDRIKDFVFKLNVAMLVFVCVVGIVELVAWQTCRILVARHRQMREPSYVAAYREFGWTEEHLENLRTSDLLLRYQPYYLWGLSEVRTSTYNVLPDWGGVRKTINVPKPSAARKVKVFMFGGSTTFCSRVPDRYTIASLLSSNLNERFPDVEFSVANLGRGGFVGDQEIVWLTQILTAGEIPHVVIFYDGVNDTINQVCQGVPHYQYERFRAIEMGRVERKGVLTTLLELDYVTKAAGLMAARQTDDARYFTDRETLLRNARNLAARYRQNMVFMKRLSEAYRFQSVFFWQPNLFTTNKELTGEESDILQNDADARVWRPGFEIADQVIKTTMVDADAFYDLSDVLDPIEECIFFDTCHVSAIANQTIGDRIAELLVQGGHLKGLSEDE